MSSLHGAADPQATNDLEATLRRVATVARILGLSWMVILGGVVLARPGWSVPGIAAVLLAGVVWAVVSWVLSSSSPFFATSWQALGVDVGMVVAAVWASSNAGDDGQFYGGLPLVVVAIAAIRSRRMAWTVAIAFLAVRSWFISVDTVVGVLGQILVYLSGALIFSWVVESIRRADGRYRAVQAELARVDAARARIEERADISRHLHDSVLQTLALLQRDADDPAKVTNLARRQERELREWMYGVGRTDPSGLAEAVGLAAAEVEDRFHVVMDLVMVGDRPMNDRLRALVDAVREAMVNAALHGGGGPVSVFAEADDAASRVFVRDRGPGFSIESIGDDRRGVRESILSRMESVAGIAELKSDSRRGSEWRLEVSGE